MDFFNQTGKIALGSRVRLLSDMITADAAQIYAMYGVDLQPKWFPVFFVLSHTESKTITALAQDIGHSHPSVSKIVGEMVRHGIVAEQRDPADKRRNTVRLTEKGREQVDKIQDQYRDIAAAIDDLSRQTRHDLWEALGEWEFLLRQKSLFRRVQEQRKERESQYVQIVDYRPEYQHAFRDLNVEWISTYFRMEAEDYKALDNPQSYILDRGGYILIALLNGEPVGTCALIPLDDPEYDYELAKMAVSPRAQGKSIGWLLGRAAIDKARQLGARGLYLESNTTLVPAINLYLKLGFEKVAGHASPYQRSDIQMGLKW